MGARRALRLGSGILRVCMYAGTVPCATDVRAVCMRVRGARVQDAAMRVGVLQALEVWLAEDTRPVEAQLVQRDAVVQLVQVYANAAQVRACMCVSVCVSACAPPCAHVEGESLARSGWLQVQGYRRDWRKRGGRAR